MDGKKVDIPSYRVKPSQVIELKEKSRQVPLIMENLENIRQRLEFVTFSDQDFKTTYVRYPERSEILSEIHENLIVEFYNR